VRVDLAVLEVRFAWPAGVAGWLAAPARLAAGCTATAYATWWHWAAGNWLLWGGAGCWWPGWRAWHPSPNTHNTNAIKKTEKPDPQPTPSAAAGGYQPPRAWPAAAAAAAPAAALTGDACWLRLPPRRQQFEGGSA
jgi:hypothetical protein